jgi:hypothetical protein
MKIIESNNESNVGNELVAVSSDAIKVQSMHQSRLIKSDTSKATLIFLKFKNCNIKYKLSDFDQKILILLNACSQRC